MLRTSDVRWIGVKPETVKTLGQAEQWQVRWVKQLPPGVTEKIEYDIVLELGFAHDRLTRVTIPERYFAVMPKQFLVGVIRSLGRGKDRQNQKEDRRDRFSRRGRRRAPETCPRSTSCSASRARSARRARTRSCVTATCRRRRNRAPGVFDMHLTFDTKSGELLKWQGITPVGRIGFDFAGDRTRRDRERRQCP